MTFVFSALLEYALVNYASRSDAQRLAKKKHQKQWELDHMAFENMENPAAAAAAAGGGAAVGGVPPGAGPPPGSAGPLANNGGNFPMVSQVYCAIHLRRHISQESYQRDQKRSLSRFLPLPGSPMKTRRRKRGDKKRPQSVHSGKFLLRGREKNLFLLLRPMRQQPLILLCTVGRRLLCCPANIKTVPSLGSLSSTEVVRKKFQQFFSRSLNYSCSGCRYIF